MASHRRSTSHPRFTRLRIASTTPLATTWPDRPTVETGTSIPRARSTQVALKEAVGALLVAFVEGESDNADAPIGCVESRRCWTLQYTEPFHLDVLPAIRNEHGSRTGILLTDKDFRNWLESDPKAYADWFRAQMAKELEAALAERAVRLGKSVEQIPPYEVKTTLQRAIQVLKRHRDIAFADDHADRPPSILITTLATRAYGGGAELYETVVHAVEGMPRYIEKINGRWWVKNPVADENFADKWENHPERREKFLRWLDALTTDLRDARMERGLDMVHARLAKSFGEGPTHSAMAALGAEYRTNREDGRLRVATTGALGVSAGLKVPRHSFHGDEDAR